MSTQAGSIGVVIRAVEDVTPLIRVFSLEAEDGAPLPGFSGGSHVLTLIPNGEIVYRNAYSLMSSPFDTRRYEIGVRRQDTGRGGSRRMHELKVGDTLRITPPVNNFALNALARKHILFAGGVGITPFVSQLQDLQQSKVPFELHYGVRDEAHARMARFLPDLPHGDVRVYHDVAGETIDFARVLGAQPLGTHVYVCGPQAMIDAVLAAARDAGWADSHVHYEKFVEQTGGVQFDAYLQRSDVHITVAPEMSLLEAIEAAGVDIPYLCRGGACGHCETNVLALDGEIEHRDDWLSPEQRACNDRIMPCVSRASCKKLVLDL
jgi:dimethylamine monooxygenase subunit B